MLNRSWIWSAPKPLLLAGPTAVGKSAVALELAGLLQGEIVSVDSMQVYRGLQIGTAKPSPAERQRVPHHLIDFVDSNEKFTAGRFALEATRVGQDIQARQKVPILCGGSGLYFQAIIEGLNDGAPSDPAVRNELESLSTESLLTELNQRDPARFASIDRLNRRRVIRAVEKARTAGESTSAPSRWERRNPAPVPEADAQARIFFVALRRSKEDLHRRIEKRVAIMFEAGLVHEAQQFLRSLDPRLSLEGDDSVARRRSCEENAFANSPVGRSVPAEPSESTVRSNLRLTGDGSPYPDKAPSPRFRGAWQAIGYKEILEFLEGRLSIPEVKELIQTRTRQFAKRQITWFKRQTDIQWIDLAPNESALATAERIAAMYLAQRPSE